MCQREESRPVCQGHEWHCMHVNPVLVLGTPRPTLSSSSYNILKSFFFTFFKEAGLYVFITSASKFELPLSEESIGLCTEDEISDDVTETLVICVFTGKRGATGRSLCAIGS